MKKKLEYKSNQIIQTWKRKNVTKSSSTSINPIVMLLIFVFVTVILVFSFMNIFDEQKKKYINLNTSLKNNLNEFLKTEENLNYISTS